MPSASSTALTEASAWTIVQTPQIRCAQIHASRGSRPRKISSIPRNIVPELQASAIIAAFDLRFDAKMPFNSRHGIDHNPRHGFLLCSARLRRFFCFFSSLLRTKFVAHHIPGDLRDHRRAHCRRGNPPNFRRRDVDSEPRDRRQPFVER